MFIKDEIIQEIREKAPLEELVSERVTLKRTGSRLVGLCPFHQEKTPSFGLNLEEGYYHCFGCGAHGDAIKFVMETRGFSFTETIKFLASRIGIELKFDKDQDGPNSSASRQQQTTLNRRLLKLYYLASTFYENFLAKETTALSKLTREYLSSRGYNETTIKTFKLGLAPSNNSLANNSLAEYLEKWLSNELSESDERKDLLLKSALVRQGSPTRGQQSDEGELFDFFRDRLIFPIARSDGKIISFGGRVFKAGDSRPKYINTAETLIYRKRKTLYGLPQALPLIRLSKRVFIVEGYFDVLALHQAGIKEVVATCGTSLTQEHAQIIARFCREVFLVFDGDTAGQKAASQCFEKFVATPLQVNVCLLPKGADPDSLLNQQGLSKAEFYNLLSKNQSSLLSQFLINETAGKSDVSSISAASHSLTRVLKNLKDPVKAELLLREASAQLGVSYESLTKLQGKESSKTSLSQANTKTFAEENNFEKQNNFRRRYSRYSAKTPERITLPPVRVENKILAAARELVLRLICKPDLLDSELENALTPIVNAEPSFEKVLSELKKFSDPFESLRSEEQEFIELLLSIRFFLDESPSELLKRIEFMRDREGIKLSTWREEFLSIIESSQTALEKKLIREEERASLLEEDYLEIAQRKLALRRDALKTK